MRQSAASQQQVARAATNELRSVRDNCGHGHLSLINNIKAIYLTGSFLIVCMKVRYSPNHYLLLIMLMLFAIGIATYRCVHDRAFVQLSLIFALPLRLGLNT